MVNLLTLPMAGLIKRFDSNAKILFLGKSYTKPIIENANFIDEFLNYDAQIALFQIFLVMRMRVFH